METGSVVILTEKDSHHLIRVLRLRVGDEVTVVDEQRQREFSGIVDTATTPAKILLTNEHSRSEVRSSVSTLIVALCKGKVNDFICEKATEIGVSKVIFWRAERSIPRLEPEKRARFQAIAESAAKQSGRLSLPEVHLLTSLGSVFEAIQGDSTPGHASQLLCSLSHEAKPLAEWSPFRVPVVVSIGPEGDFSSEEEGEFRARGFVPVSLGVQRFKVDTAALVAMAMVKALSTVEQ